MILYLDTSALVKLYFEEPHSPLVCNAVSSASLIACHLIGYAEARAAFARKARLDALRTEQLAGVRADFERDWGEISVVSVSESLVRRTGELAERFGLRGYDSLHLSAAEALFIAAGDAATFHMACFDSVLTKGAAALGIDVIGAS